MLPERNSLGVEVGLKVDGFEVGFWVGFRVAPGFKILNSQRDSDI